MIEEAVLVFTVRGQAEQRGIYAGSLDGKTQKLLPGIDSSALYVAGYLLYLSQLPNMGVPLLTCITAKETIRVKATSCCSRMPAIKPNRAATRLSVANDSEACSSSMAVPHEFFDLTRTSEDLRESENPRGDQNSPAGCNVRPRLKAALASPGPHA
jgi:hypothetical protein